MGSTSIRDVGSLFGGLNIGAQDLLAGKISNNISATGKSDSASFQSFLSNSSNAADMNIIIFFISISFLENIFYWL